MGGQLGGVEYVIEEVGDMCEDWWEDSWEGLLTM